jgi:hypothetical protein
MLDMHAKKEKAIADRGPARIISAAMGHHGDAMLTKVSFEEDQREAPKEGQQTEGRARANTLATGVSSLLRM